MPKNVESDFADCNGLCRFRGSTLWLPCRFDGEHYFDPRGLRIVAPDEFRVSTARRILAEFERDGIQMVRYTDEDQPAFDVNIQERTALHRPSGILVMFSEYATEAEWLATNSAMWRDAKEFAGDRRELAALAKAAVLAAGMPHRRPLARKDT